MLEEWFIARRGPDGNKRYGPVSLSQLREMVTSGRVAADDLVWREGMANWVRTDQCGEVSSLLPPPPPPPPPPRLAPPPPPPPRRPEYRPEYHREPAPEPRRGYVPPRDERPFPPRRPPVKSSNGWVAVVAVGGVVLLVGLLVCGGGFVVSLMQMRPSSYGTSSSSYYNPPTPVVDPGPDFFQPPPPLPPVADAGLGTRLEYNPSEVYYTAAVTLDEAQRLGDYLDGKGFLPHDHRATVQVNHDFLGTVQVRFCVNPDAVNDQATIDVYRGLRRDLVQDVYPLQTVEVHLCDGNMNTLRAITFLDN